MAEEQEPKTEPEQEPKTEPDEKPKDDGGESIKDSHGQEGISKAKYERERREWEAKVADLKAQLNGGLISSRRSTDKWGDGARAIVRVRWDRRHGGGGHFFSARREGDNIVYEDPQAGTVRDIGGTLEKCSPLYGDTWLMRVDDRKLTDLVREAVENA